MTTTALPTAREGSRRRPGRATMRLIASEARLFVRDPAAMFFALGFPVVLLTVLGLVMPWADQPYDTSDPLLARITAITGYTPIVLSLAVATVSLSLFPAVVAGYRQRGVLRRLSTTPIGPSRLLIALIVVYVVALLLAAVLALVSGRLVLGISMPVRPGVVLLAFLLAALSAFALGALVAAWAPTVGAANGVGQTLYMLSMFFAGVWLPLPLMPDAVQAIAAWTPLGAASQAMTAAWVGAAFPTMELVVMAAWAAVGIPLAARLFRWS